ncbi:MAG: ATP-binding cassette domain-containing protein [Candidatus Hydrogenedens sp.]|nr:ATP-binding cassette domain-containing protein [Candidatus Hydrogenedentota bacterium]NLF58149.1 ATP-binding cassette domain-containing protein [Candidatus Hydrogenedens sp.]
MIAVEGLTKYYGAIPAIQGVSFAVGKGEIVGFLGPNGAGKSTTMRVLTGFSPASRGTARVAGFEVHEHPVEVKRRIGYLPESVPLYEEMVVRAFLAYVAEVKGVPRPGRRAEVDRVMERCGLTQMANRLTGNLSKGYRQRVGLAQALVGSPPVLVLDEPTVGLDPGQIIEIREMIRELGREHTVLLSTHILPEVTMVCDRVIIINRGRIALEDSMANLTKSGGRSLEEVFMGVVASDRVAEGAA